MTDKNRNLLHCFSNHREILVEESNVQRVDSPVTVSVSLFNFLTCFTSDLNILTWCTRCSPHVEFILPFHCFFSDRLILTQRYNPDIISVWSRGH